MNQEGKAKVIGAIYEVGTGTVNWLPQKKTTEILKSVEANPARAMEAMAGGGHGAKAEHAAPAESKRKKDVGHHE